MAITADERRSILGLFNVSEAARQLGVPVRKMHWEITAGRLPRPRIRLGRRAYYTADDLPAVAEQCSQKNKTLEGSESTCFACDTCDTSPRLSASVPWERMLVAGSFPAMAMRPLDGGGA